jgi:hypothetical protein
MRARLTRARSTAPFWTIALALPGQRDRVVGIEGERIAIEAHRLARQTLSLRDAGQRNIGAAVARTLS